MGGRGGIPFTAMRAFLSEYGVTDPDERETFYSVMEYVCGVESKGGEDASKAPGGRIPVLDQMVRDGD